MVGAHPLRRWRTSQEPEVTLSALARAVAVQAPYLSMIERGLKTPSLPLAGRLRDRTGIPIDEILQFSPQREAAE